MSDKQMGPNASNTHLNTPQTPVALSPKSGTNSDLIFVTPVIMFKSKAASLRTFPSIYQFMEQLKDISGLFDKVGTRKEGDLLSRLDLQMSLILAMEKMECSTCSETLDLEALLERPVLSIVLFNSILSNDITSSANILSREAVSEKNETSGASIKKSVKSSAGGRSKLIKQMREFEDNLLQSTSLMFPKIDLKIMEREYSSRKNALERFPVFSINLENLFFYADRLFRTPRSAASLLPASFISSSSVFLDKLYVSCPQSVLKLHSLWENWRRLDLVQDIYEAAKSQRSVIMKSSLNDDLNAGQHFNDSLKSAKKESRRHVHIRSVVFSMEFLSSLKIQIDVSSIMGVYMSSTVPQDLVKIFLKIGSQKLSLDESSLDGKKMVPILKLPKVISIVDNSIRGSGEEGKIPRAILKIMFASINHTFSLSTIDRLYLYGRILSKEINEVLELYLYSSVNSVVPAVDNSVKSRWLGIDFVELLFVGWRLDISSPKSRLQLDTGIFTGQINIESSTRHSSSSVGLPFKLQGRNSSISLASLKSNSGPKSDGPLFNSSFEWMLDNNSSVDNCISFTLVKLDITLDAISLSKLVEFYIYVKEEMLRRRQENDAVISELRGNTRRIMATIRPKISRRLALNNFSVNEVEFRLFITSCQIRLRFNNVIMDSSSHGNGFMVDKSGHVVIIAKMVNLNSNGSAAFSGGKFDEIHIFTSSGSHGTLF